MANKVITVTDPSVVTNDTLAGYNNYSDQDGQLGTTMTPTEATNGKTITLSDGVVHEVTTKPVGTTNGEFSAVVSNAVTVDLVGLSFTLFAFSESGDIYTKTEAAAGYANNYAVSISPQSGAFTYEIDFANTSDNNFLFGLSTSGTNREFNNATPWDYGIFFATSSPWVKTIINGVSGTADVFTERTPTAGHKVRLTRDGANGLKCFYFDGSTEIELNDFGTVTASDLYLHFSQSVQNGTISNPAAS